MRLKRRIERLEGGRSHGIDLIVRVPDEWPEDRAEAEIDAIARAHGASPPLGRVIILRSFGATADTGLKLIFIGRLGAENMVKSDD